MTSSRHIAETVIAWVEGLAVVAGIAFLFYDWYVSVAALVVFIVCLPARNYVKYGQFSSGGRAIKATPPIESPLQGEISGSLSRSAASGPAKTI